MNVVISLYHSLAINGYRGEPREPKAISRLLRRRAGVMISEVTKSM
jgi:hypothetical protein